MANSCKDIVEKAQFHGAITEKEALKLLRNLPKKTKNNAERYADCDEFKCHMCGIWLTEWKRLEEDDDGEITCHEYEFRFCPNCGAEVSDDEQ